MSAIRRVWSLITGRLAREKWQYLVAQIERLQAAQAAMAAAQQAHAAAALAASAAVAAESAVQRRALAEQRLWSQLDRLEDLDLRSPRRSVIFTRHAYYHYFYLARALRRRGWRALCVSFEDPNGTNSQYYHGEDVNMWDPDPAQLRANVEATHQFAKRYFDLMHFSGDRCISFYPWHFGEEEPEDIAEWKRLGKKVAYTISGCNSATTQSSFERWSRAAHGGRPMCDQCVWRDRPGGCSDEASDRWGRTMHRWCDLVFTELQPSLDHLHSRFPNVVRGPHVAVMDPAVWSPELDIPPAYRLAREPGELLVFHAVGNYREREEAGRSIKGTPAVVEAVDRLRAEGLPVRLMFFTSVPNNQLRYYQAQADIVVDQLWAGSWGANGREAMMLGKPVVGFLTRHEEDPSDLLEAIDTAPIVNATVDTVYAVLRGLVLDPARRAELGMRSREFALKWYSADAGARRYEEAYDAMRVRSFTSEQPLVQGQT